VQSEKPIEDKAIMKKFISLGLLLCLCYSTRGQTDFEYNYWFDNDRSTLHTGRSQVGECHIDADMSQLRETLHAIHVQVKDKNGVVSVPVTKYFVRSAQPSTSHGRYWFDDDVENMHALSQLDGAMNLDVREISEGFHILHYQTIGVQGTVSATVSHPFYKTYVPDMTRLLYWFDQDSTYMRVGYTSGGAALLNVAHLQDGLHVLHVMADGGNGGPSLPVSHAFLKVPQVMATDYLTCRFIIDGQLYKQELVSARGGTASCRLDVSDVPQGLHRLYVQVLTPSGTVTATYSKFFLRVLADKDLAGLRCLYAIDGGETQVAEGSLTDGTNHYDIDVSQLTDGDHQVSYLLSDAAGMISQPREARFTKYVRGDVNSDRYIDVADLSGVVRFILEMPVGSLIFAAADLDENEVVDVNDFSGMANLILYQEEDEREVRARRIAPFTETLVGAEAVRLDADGEGELIMSLAGNHHFTGMQFDLRLPDGVELLEDKLQSVDGKHECWCAPREDGTCRVVCASMRNAELDEGMVLRLPLKSRTMAVGTIDIEGVVLTDAQASRTASAPIHAEISGTTSLASVNSHALTIMATNGALTLRSTADQTVRVVAMNGTTVANVPLQAGKEETIPLPAGIYIVDNRKVIIR